MPLNITPVTNHRKREKGVIVYPVYSRRSAGLSIGINLFPDKKSCPFDCPYCEVFPFSSKAVFSLEQLEDDLCRAISGAQKQNTIIKDICFSGNGEPTLSPAFPNALKLAEDIRAKNAPSARLVVITNGAGLLQPRIFSLLKEYASLSSTDIWLKVDAGTEDWYNKINRCAIPFEKLIAVIKEFVSCAVVTIQTMLCAINGEQPSETERQAWESLVCGLAANTKKSVNNIDGKMTNAIRKIQLYGKARSAPEDPLASQLAENYLEERAASLRRVFVEKDISIPVEVYM
jgi:wyosine [tRNA(Phe)-imidazoG37] synthetase (radical SAM superfamily)